MAAGTLGFTALLISGLQAQYEPPHAAYWLRAWRLSRRMAQQASLESQSKAQALAILSQLNNVAQRHPLQLDPWWWSPLHQI